MELRTGFTLYLNYRGEGTFFFCSKVLSFLVFLMFLASIHPYTQYTFS